MSNHISTCIITLKTTGLWLLICLLAQPSIAKSNTSKNELKFQIDSIASGVNGDVLTLTAALQNPTEDDFVGTIDIQLPEGINLLNQAVKINIKSKEKLFIPLRFRIGSTVPSNLYKLVSQVKDETGKVLISATTALKIQAVKNILIQPLTRELIMTQAGDSVLLQLQIKNIGNTKEKLKILSSLPSSKSDQGKDFFVHELQLAPAQDTILTTSYFINNHLFSLGFFNINITGIYEEDEVFANTRVNVQSITSNRTFNNAELLYSNWLSQKNTLLFSVRNILSDQQSWLINGNGKYELNKGVIDFQLNAQQWPGSEVPYVNNTWVQYEIENSGIKLGTINENFERYISGRGVKLHHSDPEMHNRYQFGFSDKNYNLLQPTSSTNNTGYSIFGTHEHSFGENDDKKLTGTALFDRDNYENAESVLYSQHLQFNRSSKNSRTTIGLQLGGGLSKPIELKPMLEDFDYKPSVALGVNIMSKMKQYMLTSVNYYSTGYYPGNRKGVLQSNQQISRNFGSFYLWAGVNHYEFAPKSFHLQQQFNNYFMLSKAELGASFSVNPFFQISISPRYDLEKSRYSFLGENQQIHTYKNYRLSQYFNWRSRNNKHQTNIILEAGIEDQKKEPLHNNWQGKVNIVYYFKEFSLSAYYQKGAFTLSEKIANTYNNYQNPYRFSASTSYSKRFLNDKLQSDLSLAYFEDGLSGQNFNAYARIQYLLNRKAAFFINTQTYQFKNSFYSSTPTATIQVGYIQKLPENREDRKIVKTGKIIVRSFYDHNHNGVFDKDDELAKNKLILIDGLIFITDKNGEVIYNKVPRGAHTISAPIENGWHGLEQGVSLHKKSETWQLPLTKSGTLQGQLKFELNERLNREVKTRLEGFVITAKNQNGNVTTTRTDANGQYYLFLPEGTYEIALRNVDFPEFVYTETLTHQVTIKSAEVNIAPVFLLQIQNKDIQIKRFQSNP